MKLNIFYVKRNYTKENILFEIYILNLWINSLNKWSWIYSI